MRVKAFGLNRMDLLQREGRYPVPPQAPSTMGVEFSGVIESLAKEPGQEGLNVGDQVFGLTYGGMLTKDQRSNTYVIVINAHRSE